MNLENLNEIFVSVNNHNRFTDLFTEMYQLNNGIYLYDTFLDLCNKNKKATVLIQLPEKDIFTSLNAQNIKTKQLWKNNKDELINICLNEKKDELFIYNFDSYENYYNIHVPVLSIINNEDYIILKTDESISIKFEELDKSKCVGVDAENLIKNMSKEKNKLLYVEYIQDFYFKKIGWESIHNKYKIVAPINRSNIGIKRVSLTPHY